jgi:hypothetical protein
MPPIPAPEPGLVIRYDYLWATDAAGGRDSGKDRPACLVVVIDKPGMPLFAGILPITHTSPATESEGIEIPGPTRRRPGLDDGPCRVKFSEYNVEFWPPPGLSPVPGCDSFTYGFNKRPFEGVNRSDFRERLIHHFGPSGKGMLLEKGPLIPVSLFIDSSASPRLSGEKRGWPLARP